MDVAYYVAGIDVHKKMLAVVVANARDQELHFDCLRFGTTISELRNLSAWLQERDVREVVMESTAQYWKPVWLALEGQLREFAGRTCGEACVHAINRCNHLAAQFLDDRGHYFFANASLFLGLEEMAGSDLPHRGDDLMPLLLRA